MEQFISEVLEPTPFELVQVVYARQGSDWALRVFVDHPDGITLDHCGEVTRLLLDRIEENDPASDHDYHLEVSSPGVDRPLNKSEDFVRFLGERAYIKSHKPLDGRKVFTGILSACADGVVSIENEEDAQTYQISLNDIAKACLKPELEFN